SLQVRFTMFTCGGIARKPRLIVHGKGPSAITLNTVKIYARLLRMLDIQWHTTAWDRQLEQKSHGLTPEITIVTNIILWATTNLRQRTLSNRGISRQSHTFRCTKIQSTIFM